MSEPNPVYEVNGEELQAIVPLHMRADITPRALAALRRELTETRQAVAGLLEDNQRLRRQIVERDAAVYKVIADDPVEDALAAELSQARQRIATLEAALAEANEDAERLLEAGKVIDHVRWHVDRAIDVVEAHDIWKNAYLAHKARIGGEVGK